MTLDNGPLFEIREERVSGRASIMRLYGEFDLAGRERFEAALERSVRGEAKELVIDLSGLTFLDSSAIRALLDAKRCADQDGFDVLLTLPADGQVRKVLKLTGVDRVFSSPVGVTTRSADQLARRRQRL